MMGRNGTRFRPPFPARAVLIDLDGTLLDTAADLATAANLMLADLKHPPIEPARIRTFIGSGVRQLVRRTLAVFGEARENEIEAALEIFMGHYKAHLLDSSRLYPGVIDTVQKLTRQGRALGCITNKLDALTQQLLKAFDIDFYFDLVLSGDSLPSRKPDPMPLLYASEALGVPVEEMLMVGDSRTDAEAAFAAGVPIVCVSYGYNGDQDVRELNPDAVIESFSELPALFA